MKFRDGIQRFAKVLCIIKFIFLSACIQYYNETSIFTMNYCFVANCMDATELKKLAPCYTIFNILRENRGNKDGGHSTIFLPSIVKAYHLEIKYREPTKFGSGLPYSTLWLKCRPQGFT